jgi:hypothetical protein
MDEKQRQAIGLKKFSIISPVINGQHESNIEYFRSVAAEPIDMPHLGMRKYSERTLQGWLNDYRRYGLDGLVKDQRSDKGKHRRITAELSDKIVDTRKSLPGMPITVFYEQLISEGIIDPLKVSRSTIYRFVEDMNIAGAFKEETDETEIRRFSYEYVGDLMQADVLYGPKVKVNGKKQQVYLHMFIDDRSRYPMYSQFYLAQNFESLRRGFKEAVMRRGVPRLMYTDNGKIYRSQQFEFICASLGCTLLHSQPFVPRGRGKVERIFKTVRMRFLSRINENDIESLDQLNMWYFKWLEEDYCRKAHSGLDGLTPHDVLMSQVDRLKIITDKKFLDECFMYRLSRKVQHDATVQIDNVLYETDPVFSGKRIDLRYEPEWIGDETKTLPIYMDGKNVSEAKMVRFYDNAHMKRRYPGNRKSPEMRPDSNNRETQISFADMMVGGDSNV